MSHLFLLLVVDQTTNEPAGNRQAVSWVGRCVGGGTDVASRGAAPEPLRIRLREERHARALERELGELARLAPGRDGIWELTVDSLGDKLVVRVLNAVSSALAGESTASALVLLNGREYRLQGE